MTTATVEKPRAVTIRPFASDDYPADWPLTTGR